MKKVTYRIGGMSCAACSSGIERSLARATGVAQAQVNLTAAKAYVTYDPQQISEADIIDRIEKLGFTVLPPEQEIQAVYHLSSFIVAAVCTVLLLYVSMGGHMLGLPLPDFLSHHTHPLGFALAQLILTLPVLIAGRHFYRSGWPRLLHGHPNMDSLIALSTTAALLYSLYSLLRLAQGQTAFVNQLYFETATMIVTLVILGKFLEERAKHRADDAVRELLALAPEEAIIEQGGEQKTVPASQLRVGDVVVIKQGARLPADGVVLSGGGSVDESYLTGESLSREVSAGDEVQGGTINVSGAFRCTVSRSGDDSTLAQIARLMEQAQAGKAPVSRLADKAAAIFVPTVLGLSLLVGMIWYLCGADFIFSLRIFMAMLVIACPCALGLATPTALTVAMGRAAQLGLLFKSGAVLEEVAHLRQVALDKTGTLTQGKPALASISLCGAVDENAALRDAYALEREATHPLAVAICTAAQDRGIDPPPVQDLQTPAGYGLSGQLDGRALLLGSERFLREQGIKLEGAAARVEIERNLGRTAVFLAVDNRLAAIFFLADQLKPEAREAIAQLHELQLSTVLITGDNTLSAAAAARGAGLDTVRAEVLPAGKVEALRELQQGGKTAMIGDGVNDAPAFKQADVGMAVKSGADIALSAADVVFLRDDLRLAATSVRLARATLRNIRQNLIWAFCYNIAALPIAAGLLYIWGGPLLSPVVGAAAMSLSSVCVVSNALRLKNFKR